MVPSGNPALQAGEERWWEGDGKGEEGRREAERAAALPLPAALALLWQIVGCCRLATACCRAARGADGGSPVLWLGLIQTLPCPLTP